MSSLPTILRVVSSVQDPVKRIAYIPVTATTTVGEAASRAHTIFAATAAAASASSSSGIAGPRVGSNSAKAGNGNDDDNDGQQQNNSNGSDDINGGDNSSSGDDGITSISAKKRNFSLVVETGRARVRGADFTLGTGSIKGQFSMTLDPSWKLMPYIVPYHRGGGGGNSGADGSNGGCGNGNGDDDGTPAIIMMGSRAGSQAAECGEAQQQQQQQEEEEDPSLVMAYQAQPQVAPWSVVAYLVVAKNVKVTGDGDGDGDGTAAAAAVQQQSFSAPNVDGAPSLPDGRLLLQALNEAERASSGEFQQQQQGAASLQHLPQRLQAVTESLRPCSFTD